MIWTADADALMLKLWEKGLSIRQIAIEMGGQGYNVSRNMIAGRKHRLKAPPPPIKVQKERMMTKPKLPPKPVQVVDLTTHKGVDYLANSADGCKAIMPTRSGKWQLQMVCGVTQGFDHNGSRSSYCPAHLRLYTNQAAAR